ncbi:uncharacterized protein spa17 isoform X2 [Trichomycterus rosablanca]|uniref:uncharacterized protein spa17 isoform X2 n=1 Tax=Trichomycterus rosablanca TaxID=2290929 RepID=UPI002F35771D
MAVPFSNTSLRVPSGFGNILEGLAREVLREQPADIPTFAAGYFTALLQKREESGLDPAEWGAQLEDRFYNNNAFRASVKQENFGSVKQSESPVNRDKAGSTEHNEDKTFPSPQISSPLSKTLDASEDIVEPQSNMLEKKTDDYSGETEPEFSYRGTADIDICAQELNTKEQTPRNLESYFDEENDTVENEICASELNPMPLSTYHGLADVDVCGEDLQPDLSVNEHNKASRDMTEVSFTQVSESPEHFLVEEESQDDLDTDDEFCLPGAEISAPIKDAAQELHDTDKTDTSTVEEEGKINAAKPKNEQLQVKEPSEINDILESFDEMSTDEVLGAEIQEVKDVLAETEAMIELSSSNLENLEDSSSNANTDIQNFENTTIVDGDWIHQSEDIHEGDCEANLQEQEKIVDKPTDSQDTLKTTPDDSMGISKGLADSNLSDSINMDVQQDDTKTSQHDVSEFEDTFEAGSLSEVVVKEDRLFHSIPTQVPGGALTEPASGETNDPNETQIKEEHLFHSVSTEESTPASRVLHEENTDLKDNHLFHTIPSNDYDIPSLKSKSVETDEENNDLNETETVNDDKFHTLPTHVSGGASHGPTAFETEEDTEVTYEECAADSPIGQDYKESRLQEDISREVILENKDKELDQQEDSSQPQEEEDIMDIPLDDPEANKAAAKIQAGFRGHMTRKKLKPGEKPGEEQEDQKE